MSRLVILIGSFILKKRKKRDYRFSNFEYQAPLMRRAPRFVFFITTGSGRETFDIVPVKSGHDISVIFANLDGWIFEPPFFGAVIGDR